MSKENNTSSYAQRKLKQLRSRLTQASEWPETAKDLLENLADFDAESAVSMKDDMDMFPLIVGEAYKGTDIAVRFPSLYKRLLRSAELREAFLDALDMLESEANGEIPSLPQELDVNLAFLETSLPQRTLKKSEEGGWEILWQHTIEQLQSLISPLRLDLAISDPARNDGENLMDESLLMLLDDEVELEEAVVSIVLYMTPFGETSDALDVFLRVAPTLDPGGEIHLTQLRAVLKWGSFEERVQITKRGQATFSPIPFQSILDQDNRNVTASMQLALQHPPQKG